MGTCRQTMSLWFYLRRVFNPKHTTWRSALKRLAILDLSGYFWHDSFGKYLNHLVRCRLFGHGRVKFLSDGNCDNDRPKHYCFDCEHEVDPGIDKVVTQ